MSADLIEAALSAELAKLGLPIAWPNAHFDPTAAGKTPYVTAVFVHGPVLDATLAKGSPRLSGTLIATHVSMYGGNGIPQTRSAVQIAALFPANTIFRQSDFSVRITEHPQISGGQRDGAYWRVPVRIRFEA